MRQNSMSRRWTTAQLLRSVEEAHIDRSTRLGLSDIPSGSRVSPESIFEASGISQPPPATGMEFPFTDESMRPGTNNNRAFAGASSSRHPRSVRHMLRSRNLDSATSEGVNPATTTTDMDIFHDCMDLEEDNNPTFSNIFDDLDLEGSELILPTSATRNDHRGSAVVQHEATTTTTMTQRGETMYNSGNGSRGSSCKRKSCNLPPSSSPMRQNIPQANTDGGMHTQRQLILGPPSAGASSSRSGGVMEGPRAQKTRLSSDAVEAGPVVFGGNGYRGDFRLDDSSPGYPRSVRRAFQATESVRSRRTLPPDYTHVNPDLNLPGGGHSRRSLPLEYPQVNPDLNLPSNYAGHLASAAAAVSGTSQRGVPPENPPVAILRNPSPRVHPMAAAGPGLSRRIGRTGGTSSSSRGLASAGPSIPSQREVGESRMRSIRMACLENTGVSGHGSSLRRNVGNYFPGLGGGIPGRRANIPGEARQASGYGGRAHGFARPSPPGISPSMGFPQVSAASLLEGTVPAEMRLPSTFFEGAGGAPRAFRPVLRELATGEASFHTPDFEWERHRPRLMAGGLAEILRALERVDRDEDLTREQLLMLEATTFLFGGIGLHDDHNDWRLDIDNMSYEELLALGDRIGTVSTGVTEDVISGKLKRSLYTCTTKQTKNLEDYDLKCCVCQEEYENGVELGTIDCGHSYHKDCISQWLVRKNSCPICKATALSTSEDGLNSEDEEDPSGP